MRDGQKRMNKSFLTTRLMYRVKLSNKPSAYVTCCEVAQHWMNEQGPITLNSSLDPHQARSMVHSCTPQMASLPTLVFSWALSLNVEKTTKTLQSRCVVCYCSYHLNKMLIMKSKGNRSGEPWNMIRNSFFRLFWHHRNAAQGCGCNWDVCHLQRMTHRWSVTFL